MSAPRRLLVTFVVILAVDGALYWLRATDPDVGRWASLGVGAAVVLALGAYALQQRWYPSVQAPADPAPADPAPADPAHTPRPAPPTLPLRTDAPPVPWVGEQPWRRYQGHDLAVDLSAARLGAAELARRPFARNCHLTPHPDARVASVADAEAKLEETPAVLAQWSPVVWPVCCDHLATLVLAGPEGAELDAWEARHGFLEAAVDDPEALWDDDLGNIRAGREPEGGVNVFCCPVCHRVSGFHSCT